MTSPSIESLTVHLESAGKLGDIPAGWEATLAERLRELLRTRDSDLKAASTALRDACRRMLVELRPESREELLGVGSASRQPEVKKAYRIGQLDFAHLVLAQAASKRTDELFRQTLENPTYRRFIQEMYYGERSTSDLARLGSRTTEQTSRTLSMLRRAGIADFRKVSIQVFNFLTPAANQAFKRILERESAQLTQEASSDSGKAAHEAIMAVLTSLEPVLQTAPNFGPVPASAKELLV
ncbi:hypothetical protein [Cupriavidus pauculus]|uniref:Uncharacterized protein n=1 Tax=Cupriavidus pauculus TaxID=82633 RepID=A0A2N5C8M8_9BURK|nr:hypothetical protein [Cupriavidus pauculus]PLP98549.1 hypothetical protein CYJ10_21990 [Cupriavidus pauculus]